jgi:hypothetical protein
LAHAAAQAGGIARGTPLAISPGEEATMRMLPALAVLAGPPAAVATPPLPTAVVAHVQLPGMGDYAVTLSSNSESTLWLRQGDETVDIRLRLWDGTRLRYEVRRHGGRTYALQGEVPPTVGHPYVIGHFPQDGDVRVWLTER